MDRIKIAIIFCIIGFVLFLFASSGINARLVMQIEGTIIESNKKLGSSGHDYTIYKIKTSDNKVVEYTAVGNDQSLNEYLPIGTKIEKRRGDIDYKVNGEIKYRFPLYFYKPIRFLGIIFLLLGFFLVMISIIKLKTGNLKST